MKDTQYSGDVQVRIDNGVIIETQDNSIEDEQMRRCVPVTFFILFSLGLAACSPAAAVPSDVRAYEENMIRESQQEVTFAIVIPRYIPAGATLSSIMVQDPPLGRVSKMFKLTYGDGDKEILISEGNEYVNFSPSKSSSGYIEIGQVRVLEEERYGDWTYSWNNKSLYFEITNSGFSRSECIKVIESLNQP